MFDHEGRKLTGRSRISKPSESAPARKSIRFFIVNPLYINICKCVPPVGTKCSPVKNVHSIRLSLSYLFHSFPFSVRPSFRLSGKTGAFLRTRGTVEEDMAIQPILAPLRQRDCYNVSFLSRSNFIELSVFPREFSNFHTFYRSWRTTMPEQFL